MDTLHFDESVVLYSLLFDQGTDPKRAFQVLNDFFTSPFSLQAEQFERLGQDPIADANIFLDVATQTESSQEKAFYSQVAVLRLCRLEIFTVFYLMAQDFQRKRLSAQSQPTLSLQQHAEIKNYLESVVRPFTNYFDYDKRLGAYIFTSDFREVRLIKKFLQHSQFCGWGPMLWVEHLSRNF